MANYSTTTTAVAHSGRKEFISVLKSEFMSSPLASNAALSLILLGLEKAVEVGFACPCDPTWNALFVSAYFVLPGVSASVLMLAIKGVRFWECKCQEWKNLLFFGLVPVITWLILMLFDGLYFACAMTNWTGRFVIVDKADPQRWCEPTNGTSYLERMSLTQEWYFLSQAIGLGILLGCVLLLILYGASKCLCKTPTDGKDQDEEGLNISNTLELGARGADQDSCNENDSSERH